MRKILVGATVALLIAAVAAPAAASKPIDDSHKAIVCHATSSQVNPYVVIEVDVAAAGGPDAIMAHYDHAMGDLKEGKWGDYIPLFTYDDEHYGPYGVQPVSDDFPKAKSFPVECIGEPGGDPRGN